MTTFNDISQRWTEGLQVTIRHPETCQALREYAADNNLDRDQAVEEILYFFLVAQVHK